MMSALVLAAGEGRRLGEPKALAMLVGQSLLERVVHVLAQSTVDEIVVACGASGDEVALRARSLGDALDDMPLRVVHHENWRDGRTSTIQAAWASCPDGAHALIFPVDHPLVRVTTLDMMLGVHGFATAELEVIVPVVEVEAHAESSGDEGSPRARRRGHPVLLSSRLRAELLALGADEPLRDLLHRHVALEVPVDDEGILLDVNTQDDLERAALFLR